MECAIRIDQPDLGLAAASRRLRFGREGVPEILILNGKGARFEGGADAPELSLKWLPRGAADYRSEGRSYRLADRTQLLLNRGQPYRLRMLRESETFVLFFPLALADSAWQAVQGDTKPLPEIPTAAVASPHGLQARLAALRDESRTLAPDGETLSELSLAILTNLMSLAAERRRLRNRIPALKRVTRDELLRRLLRAEGYLSETGARSTLVGAASAAALSPFHLIRLFDAAYGETPLAYAAGKRLARAGEALRASDAPIAQIALAAGYESRTAFDRAFVKRFGVTPGAVRISWSASASS